MATACFTGHRKIGNAYFNPQSPTQQWYDLMQYLDASLQVLVQREPDPVFRFISGMAIGVDQLAASCVRAIMVGRPHVQFIAAIPFPSQPSNWPASSQQFYHELLESATNTFVLSEDPYAPHKMHVRDRWMVDNSDFVIAIWDGRKQGGTFYTLSYALDTDTPVLWIHPQGPPFQASWINNKEGLL